MNENKKTKTNNFIKWTISLDLYFSSTKMIQVRLYFWNLFLLTATSKEKIVFVKIMLDLGRYTPQKVNVDRIFQVHIYYVIQKNSKSFENTDQKTKLTEYPSVARSLHGHYLEAKLKFSFLSQRIELAIQNLINFIIKFGHCERTISQEHRKDEF